ncbi:MAG: cytochrome c4 [Burkholderiaceae bacterium]
MDEPALFSWRNPWLRRSMLSICALIVVSVLVGFVWLPSQHADFTAQGIWSSICRAAGAPSQWGDKQDVPTAGIHTTNVVLNETMGRAGTETAVGRGATLALQCTICHGARGLSQTDAPNLAGQYPEVIIKQLADYRAGDRISAIMQAFALRLSANDVRELAAYYAYLPRMKGAAVDPEPEAPALVRVGDPMRNIAPCGACHGGIDHKLGAPWLDGMSKTYLVAQLTAFASGERKNDSLGQMRNMARRLSPGEIEALAGYYARP